MIENGLRRIKIMKNYDKEYHRRVRIEFNLRHNVQFYRFPTF